MPPPPSSVQKHYRDYVVNGGDGPGVWEERARALGYDGEFVTAAFLPPPQTRRSQDDDDDESWIHRRLFQASCGSGCPLRLLDPPLKVGDSVMDVGCGAGHDVLLARHAVGGTGRVVGVDFCDAMLRAARENLDACRTTASWGCGDDDESIVFVEADLENEGERLLLLSEYRASMDVITSNGVVNLCRDKSRVLSILFELLKPGGRLALSDVCQLSPVNVDPGAPIAASVGDVFSS